MDSQTRVRPAESVVSATIDGGVTIFNPASDRYYTLEAVGATIWSLLEPGATLDAIANDLVRLYEVDRERCERDLASLVGQLQAEGLVVLQGEALRPEDGRS